MDASSYLLIKTFIFIYIILWITQKKTRKMIQFLHINCCFPKHKINANNVARP